MATAAARTYVDFAPPHSETEEPGMVSLRIDLSAEGFKKEQIRVQIDNLGTLRVRGERPLGADGSPWRRFGKDFQVPDTCDAAGIRARLDRNGLLFITMPKLSAPAPAPAAEGKQPPEAPAGANTGGAAAAAGQDYKPAARHAASRQRAAGTTAAEATEEKGHEEDAAGAAMDPPGEDEHHSSSDDDAAAPAARRPAAYGFAKDSRRRLLAILAVVLALVGASLLARYRLMDPSAETAPSGNHIVSLSDS